MTSMAGHYSHDVSYIQDTYRSNLVCYWIKWNIL